MKQIRDAVEFDTYVKALNDIPRHLYPELAKFFNVRNVSIIFKGRSVTRKNYEKLLNFLYEYNQTAFSFVGQSVEIDFDQQRLFLQKLNKYIGSVDFNLLPGNKKSDIIEEQKRLSKYLNSIN